MAVAPLSVSESYSDVWQSIYNGFVVAGFSEELCKLLLLAFVVWRSRHFNEYFDGIVYAVFLSLGFAGVENLLYVFGQETMMLSMTTAVVRAAVSVPGHFLFAVAMGYYLALAKFEPAKRLLNLIKAFLVPVMLHGAFDTLLMLSSAMSDYATEISLGLLFLFVFFDIKLWKAGKRKLRRLQMKSEIQNYENLTDIETE
jgi:RsiW-degrading membrane proteinase PrsW (M82 family)